MQYVTPAIVGYPSPTPFIANTTISGSCHSELTDVEINGRRQINDFWSVLLGFRYLGLDEGMTIQQDFTFIYSPVGGAFTHDIGAVNDLYGFQIAPI